MCIFNHFSNRSIPFRLNFLLGLIFVLLSESCQAASEDAKLGDGLFARISTNKGDIVLRLEYKKAPLTVCNFVALAEGKMTIPGNKPFYDGLPFHRVVPNFMIQGGDPLGNGSGGPGYKFPDEFDPGLKHDGPGILSMANAGPGTNGSQFFITHTATPWLDGKHSVFGRVVQGQDVVNSIQQGDTIQRITIIRNGEDARDFQADQAAFDSLLKAALTAEEARRQAARDMEIALIKEEYPEAMEDSQGIFVLIRKPGKGPKPQVGDTVTVKYQALLLSGRVFDNSDLHGGSVDFVLGRILPGLDLSLQDMNPGEERIAIVPPELAYGEQGAGNGAIPPNAFIVFDLELAGVK